MGLIRSSKSISAAPEGIRTSRTHLPGPMPACRNGSGTFQDLDAAPDSKFFTKIVENP